jgi:hypothetical protein
MKFTALTRLERNVHRAGEIIGVLAKYGLADWVKGQWDGWHRANAAWKGTEGAGISPWRAVPLPTDYSLRDGPRAHTLRDYERALVGKPRF